jgi:tetratricopeptide (TPR) repeat protein
MGNLLRDQEKYDDAIAEYRTAIQLDPNYALPHNQLGEVLLVYQNKPDQAMASHSVLS